MTRAEIASMLGISVRTFKRHEGEWGLKDCRVTISQRTIRYERTKAMRRLLGMGLSGPQC